MWIEAQFDNLLIPTQNLHQNTFFKFLFSDFKNADIRERSGSMVESLTRDRRAEVRASPVSLRCVLEQDTLILA